MEKDNKIRIFESVEEIRKYLQHRYPFLFIDKVKSVELGRTITALKNVTYRDCLENGDGRMFPPEYFIEIFGEAAILLFYADTSNNPRDIITILVGIDKFNIYGKAVEGDCIEAQVSFERVISNAAIITGRAIVDGKTIAEARLSAAFIQKPN